MVPCRNAQRHDLGSFKIPINQTGFLGPASTVHGDPSPYNGSGYSSCWDDHNNSCGIVCQREAHAGTCWEHWSPETWLEYMLAQAGPGGNVHVDNEDMIGDGVCGQLDLNGNRFVDHKQRPQDYDEYQWTLVNITRKANALLPPGAPTHKILRYIDTYSSTGTNDSTLFPDAWVTSRDGTQQVYENCTKPGGPVRVQMKIFYGDGENSFSRVLTEYIDLSFEMGATGIFHDEFPHSAYSYTYLHRARWDNRSVFLDKKTLEVKHLVSSLVLLTNQNEINLAKLVASKGGTMVCNGAPHTRSWYQMAEASAIPPNSENENSNAHRAGHTQLFTPICLNRYGGNLRDEDPRYNYSDAFPHDPAQRLQFMLDPCISVHDHLDFGVLSMGYDGLWPNTTAPNIYGQMTPTTPVEIGEGFVIGLERVITSRAGLFVPPTGAGPYTKATVYVYTKCFLGSVTEHAGTSVRLDWLGSRDIAVIVWG